MCGIVGIYSYHPAANVVDPKQLLRIRERMINRGPDDVGEWWSDDRRAAFGHRRLSIIDVSQSGHQPMHSACGRYTVVFNGEIYNYPQLRSGLERQGVVFRSHSDTEVLLVLFALKGEAMVHQLRGMFAFAIWDNVERRIFAARDAYGIKPFYYADDGWTFSFASQVKALLAGGKVSSDPNPAGVCGFLVWGSVPEPETMYMGIKALPAGCTLIVDQAGPQQPKPFFCLANTLQLGRQIKVADEEVEVRIQEAARNTVSAHLLSDVEVGVFLSAGIDSGAMLGLMRDVGAKRIRAVTLGFTEFAGTDEDESLLAAKVAARYGADHIVRFVDQAEFLDDLPLILDQMDQPSIDGINTWFVSKAASEAGLKVALSGLGSDEILGGYPSFEDVPNLVRKIRPLSMVPGLGLLARILLSRTAAGRNHPKLSSMAEFGGSYPGAYFLRRGLFMPWELGDILNDTSFIAEGIRRLDFIGGLHATLSPDPVSPIARVAALESSHYMRNQLLRDSDWAGMAHGLEIRVPFVDVEFLRGVAPVVPHLKGRRGKEALAIAPIVALPLEVQRRAKTGFGVPTGKWLEQFVETSGSSNNKGAVSRNWARHLLSTQKASQLIPAGHNLPTADK